MSGLRKNFSRSAQGWQSRNAPWNHNRQLALVVAVRSILVKPLTHWTPTGTDL